MGNPKDLPGKIAEIEAELRAIQPDLDSPDPALAAATRARVASLLRSLRWAQARMPDRRIETLGVGIEDHIHADADLA